MKRHKWLWLVLLIATPLIAQRSLMDRVQKGTPDNDHISVHALTAAMYMVAEGEFTVAQLYAKFEMTPLQQGQMDQIVTYYQGLNANDKIKFFFRFEAAGVLLESGFIDQAKYKSLLGVN